MATSTLGTSDLKDLEDQNINVIGGISFNKISVGRKRTVKFKIANTSEEDLVVNRISVTNFTSNSNNSSSTDFIYQKLVPTSRFFGTEDESRLIPNEINKNQSSNTIFSLTLIPHLPIKLQPKSECECGICFIPPFSGVFNAILEITSLGDKLSKQQITLEGNGELPTSPQLVYSQNITKDSKSPEPNSYLLSKVLFTEEDINKDHSISTQKDWNLSSIPNKVTSNCSPESNSSSNSNIQPLKDSWEGKNINFISPNSIEKGRSQTSINDSRDVLIIDLERRIKHLEHNMEMLLSGKKNSRRKSNETLYEIQPHDNSFFLDQTNDPIDNTDDWIDSNQIEEENDKTIKLSESSEQFLQEMRSPVNTKNTPSSENWRDFVSNRNQNNFYSPSFSKMERVYSVNTPQVNAMYNNPDFNSSFWKDNHNQYTP